MAKYESQNHERSGEREWEGRGGRGRQVKYRKVLEVTTYENSNPPENNSKLDLYQTKVKRENVLVGKSPKI